MRLLARNNLIKTGPVDYAVWSYRPFLGRLQRSRFSLALSLLPTYSARVLEIGYGSGIFLPALKSRTNELYGVDVHDKHRQVQDVLAKEGVYAQLIRARAEELPFGDGTFDSVVAVSSLEFVSDLETTCKEIQRVLKANGSFVVVTPSHSVLADLGLFLLTGKSAKEDFGARREFIIPTLLQLFEAKARIACPPRLPSYATLYHALQLAKRA